jgi:DNA-binding GntR family transcriptional regulator
MIQLASTDSAARSRDKLSEQVYQRLKTDLHKFLFTPGQRLSEAALAEQMGVSRTPIREALTRLRDEGLVEVESKTGWFVRPIDFDRIDQLYDLRVLLELDAVTRLSQAEAPEQLLAPLRQAWLLPSGERLRDGPAVGELDERFHSALVKAAGNDEIARVHDDVTGRIRIVRRLDFTRDDRIDATYQEHARILRAVLQRKADQAKMLLRAHIEQSKAEVRSITLHTLHQAQRRRIA